MKIRIFSLPNNSFSPMLETIVTVPCNDFLTKLARGRDEKPVDQYLERKFLGKNKMHGCDISACFLILGIFN